MTQKVKIIDMKKINLDLHLKIIYDYEDNLFFQDENIKEEDFLKDYPSNLCFQC